MTHDQAAHAADLLWQARISEDWLPSLPEALRPQTNDAAYAVQDLVMAQLGTTGAWKVGAPGIAATPNCAPIARSVIFGDGATVPGGLLRLRGVEVEIGFKLGADLPPRDRPYETDDIRAAIASTHLMLEIVESRYVDWRVVDKPSVLADFNSNGALVVGPALPEGAGGDYTGLTASVTFDGVEKASFTNGNPAKDLLRLVTWLANHCAARCGGLRSGDLVTTGSHTGMQFAVPGTKVTGSFSSLGSVSAQL